jgi:protocatechuate 3,4-dioxygenase beta subunit
VTGVEPNEESPMDDRSAGTNDPASLDPPYLVHSYGSTHTRAPARRLLPLPAELVGRHGPVFGDAEIQPEDSDLTVGGGGEPIGERMIVCGRVTDSSGRPVRHQLVEIWQANSAGRYAHEVDQHPAPLDANFTGAGRCLTDADGGYRFVTIKPGEYPWGNHANAWRPAHIHFSLFGTAFASRLVTQMYFPGDPLLDFDPMYQSIRDRTAAAALIARFDLDATVEGWALGYRFDVVLGGTAATPLEG